MGCTCGGTFKKVHRPHRDGYERVRWNWFLECSKCRYTIKQLTHK